MPAKATDDIKPSGEFAKSTTRLAAAFNLISLLKPISLLVNETYKAVAPQSFQSVEDLNASIMSTRPWARVMAHNDPLVLHGRSIAVGRQTSEHVDPSSVPGEWVPIVCLGHHKGGGELHSSTLKATVRFESGDMIWLRGGELLHEIQGWEEGQRLSITHFMHR